MRIAEPLLDLLLPPRCPGCGEATGEDRALCPGCWGRLTFLVPPWCRICGLPFELDSSAVGAGTVCGGCAAKRPSYERLRSALAYDEASRGMILALKHGDRTDTAPALARFLERLVRAEALEADLIVPVPLHRWRLWRRRFNQSALVAGALGRTLGLPVIADALTRWRATVSQKGLGPAARRRNVAGAFAATPRHGERLRGARILLVDDVVTTGATAAACANALRRAGARATTVLALARVTDLGPRAASRPTAESGHWQEGG
ncbi:MAG: ComF family protein [Azospirillaceae bacterium]